MKVKKAIQEIRVKLQNLNIVKTGHNKFAKFRYYELADFIPNVNELCLIHGISTNFSVDNEKATLEISDIESDESVVFSVPFVTPEIKGANATQNLGGAITYIKRYLYMNAFEIVENDHFDSVTGKKEAEIPKPDMPIPKTEKEKLQKFYSDIATAFTHLQRKAPQIYGDGDLDLLIETELGIDNITKCKSLSSLKQFLEHLRKLYKEA
jgi:hypothetical protein